MSSLKVKGAVGSRQIRIDGAGWYGIDEAIEAQLRDLPSPPEKVAFLVNEPAAHLRLLILRAIARERGWIETRSFVDDSAVPGRAYHEFLEHARSLVCDSVVAWAWRGKQGMMSPQLQPNIFTLPRSMWRKYLPWSGVPGSGRGPVFQD